MKDIRIIQVEAGDLRKKELYELCKKLAERLPSDVIIYPHIGNSGLLSGINVDDIYNIHYKDTNGFIDSVEVTGEELFESIKEFVLSKRGEN